LRCGDFVFPTLFTPFTHFTFFTHFTMFTRFTRWTVFTRFTRFTVFTIFTRFTRFTPFTPFTMFTRFRGVTSFVGRFRRPVSGERFVRVGRTVFAISEVEIRRFKELKAAERDLHRVGIQHLHELAASDRDKLAAAMNYRREEVDVLLKLSKQLLGTMEKK
jgi:hypothetical protein